MIQYENFVAGSTIPVGFQRLALHVTGILAVGQSTTDLQLSAQQAVLLHTVFDLQHFKLVDDFAALAFAACFKDKFPAERNEYNPAVVCVGRTWRSSHIWLGWDIEGSVLDCQRGTITNMSPTVRVATTLDVAETLFRILDGQGPVLYGRAGTPDND